MEIDLEKYRTMLKKDNGLIDYLVDKGGEPQWFYERWLYFTDCVKDGCKYADACIKLMKKDIDEYYRGRETDNVT